MIVRDNYILFFQSRVKTNLKKGNNLCLYSQFIYISSNQLAVAPQNLGKSISIADIFLHFPTLLTNTALQHLCFSAGNYRSRGVRTISL